MLNQGQVYSTKAAAQKKADTMRKKGFKKVYIRRVLVAKPRAQVPVTKRSDQKLAWLATWER